MGEKKNNKDKKEDSMICSSISSNINCQRIES